MTNQTDTAPAVDTDLKRFAWKTTRRKCPLGISATEWRHLQALAAFYLAHVDVERMPIISAEDTGRIVEGMSSAQKTLLCALASREQMEVPSTAATLAALVRRGVIEENGETVTAKGLAVWQEIRRRNLSQ